jgi:hypothetical protein
MVDGTTRVDARSTYQEGRARLQAAVKAGEARARAVGNARIVVLLGVVALVASIVWVPLPGIAWQGVTALVLVFGALVVIHARVFAAKERAAAACRFHERGLDRLDGKWVDFVSRGERFQKSDHPYAEDLDVFGRASLFQLLDATETRFGEERLAGWLAGGEVTGKSAAAPRASAPTEERWAEVLRERQAAAQDLEERVSFRERLATVGALLGVDKPDPRPFLAWAEGPGTVPASSLLRTAAVLLPLLVITGLAFGSTLGLPRGSWLLPVVLELLVSAQLRKKTLALTSVVSSREQTLASYADMFAAIEGEKLAAPLLLRFKERLRQSGADVTLEMRRLGRIVAFVDARNNEVFRFFIAPLLMWDVHCSISLERWRARTGKSARGWFEVLGELEALSSIAGFAFDRPDHTWPELADAPRFEAEALGHPLIAATRRVCNDVTLAGPGTALVVTGSNMSGKSTLLRSMGVNAVLALAGAPVCARRLALGPITVATSMRVSDSLDEGVSRFYAELQKLKRVVDLCRGRPGVFFLLDEILHGTNSRERLIGARAIVRELLAKGGLGAVSTHDLGIGDLANELPLRVKNVHFEEQVAEDDRMTFDYKLRQGVVQSSNALRLMKIVGIDVVEEASEPARRPDA